MKVLHLVKPLITGGYSREQLLALLEQTGRLEPDSDAYDTPESIKALGTLQLEDAALPVLEVYTQNAERKQRNLWEHVAGWLMQQNQRAALCAFYDDWRRFRLALVTLRYRGVRRPVAENYRRLSLLVKPGRSNKTFVQRLPLVLAARTLEDLREAFSIDAVSRAFYQEYLEVFREHLLAGVHPVKISKQKKQDFVLVFTARILFVSFVAKKGWLGSQEERFLPWLFERYEQERPLHLPTQFYEEWLRPLFFEAFRQGPQAKRAAGLFGHLPDDVRKIFLDAPYLNGELFRQQNGLDDLLLTDEAIRAFFRFLYSYNFLIEENTNYDTDLELSPELLGLLLEQLINSVGVGKEVGEVGAHYTPRTEVDLMCRLALVEALATRKVLSREEAARLVFTGALPEDRAQARRIWDALLDLKVLDPAVGSGAFLVGMLQVMEELFDRLRRPLGQLLDLVGLRKKILSQVLHGVDVLRWAVWMTELRLWLTLLVDLHDDLRWSEEPILPNLGLRILQGDALVQRLGDRLVPVRLKAGGLFWNRPDVRHRLHELNRVRQDYFDNRITLCEVRRREEELFDYLINLQERIVQEQMQGKQDLFGHGAEVQSGVRLSEQLQELRALRSAREQGHRPLVWWIDFSDVMTERGGFDIVIGNPPYVRQEHIRDLLSGLPPKAYKDRLCEAYRQDWTEIAAPGRPPAPERRADLYVYFYTRTLQLLRPEGVHVFIVSNSWMDTSYGRWLQEIFLRYAPLRLVINNRARRTFIADVNTVITVVLAPRREHDEPIRFCTLRKPFEDLEAEDSIRMVLAGQDVREEKLRIIVRSRDALYREGVLDGKYAGGKWGGFTTALRIFSSPFWRGGKISWCDWETSRKCALALRRVPTNSFIFNQ